MLNRAVVAALVFAAAAFLLYLANLAREALSPNEPYAASIGLPRIKMRDINAIPPFLVWNGNCARSEVRAHM